MVTGGTVHVPAVERKKWGLAGGSPRRWCWGRGGPSRGPGSAQTVGDRLCGPTGLGPWGTPEHPPPRQSVGPGGEVGSDKIGGLRRPPPSARASRLRNPGGCWGRGWCRPSAAGWGLLFWGLVYRPGRVWGIARLSGVGGVGGLVGSNAVGLLDQIVNLLREVGLYMGIEPLPPWGVAGVPQGCSGDGRGRVLAALPVPL